MTTKQLAIHIINEQYKLVGLTFDEAKKLTFEEFDKLSLTESEYNDWYIWAVDFLKKKKRGWPKKYCQREIALMDYSAGIRVNYDRKN